MLVCAATTTCVAEAVGLLLVASQLLILPMNPNERNGLPVSHTATLQTLAVCLGMELLGDWALAATSSYLAQRHPLRFVNIYKDDHSVSHRRRTKMAMFCYGIMILSMGEYVGTFLFSVCLSEKRPQDGGLATLGLCPPPF